MASYRKTQIVEIARRLYSDGPIVLRTMQRWRPLICPYHILIEQVPVGARVLDVGCGAGLFLGTLAATKRIADGLGFDRSAAAIALAQMMVRRLPRDHGVSFLCLDATAPWPNGKFDLVSLIDVMHHVSPRSQRAVFAQASARVAPGKWLLYKDMAKRPLWRSSANRLHDLIVAGQWIHYTALDKVIAWGADEGLSVKTRRDINMLWYRHELVLFQRMQESQDDKGSSTCQAIGLPC